MPFLIYFLLNKNPSFLQQWIYIRTFASNRLFTIYTQWTQTDTTTVTALHDGVIA